VPPEKWFDAEEQEWFIARARELSIQHRPPEPILLGRHLLEMGLKPSPLVGEIQRAVYELQLDNHVRTLEEAKVVARALLDSAPRENS
jgi:tRNA nucleotidyltransferase (CCA-adding enzyme)